MMTLWVFDHMLCSMYRDLVLLDPSVRVIEFSLFSTTALSSKGQGRAAQFARVIDIEDLLQRSILGWKLKG